MACHQAPQPPTSERPFKKRVPVVRYEDIKPYVYRIVSGEPSSVLCSEPNTDLVRSSGTSGGAPEALSIHHGEKMSFFAMVLSRSRMEHRYGSGKMFVLRTGFRCCRHLHADQEKCGKGMYLMFTFPGNPTLSGLPVHSSGTAYCYSSHFKDHDIHRNTSPIEAVYCPDVKQSMYCQLLCGLIDRRIVDHVGGAFAHGFVKGVRFLEDNWEEMCSNIRTGHLSDWITHVPLRDASSHRYLKHPDPALADEIVSECAGRPWDGILRRLWPGARCILTIVTGSMSQYIPILESYGAGLPIVSHSYVSTECAAGINLRPLDPPSRASYALLPNIAYYEFAEVKLGVDDKVQGTTDNFGGVKLVDLMDVKIGRCYELVITTFAGLYRYRVGDLFTVSGFYNATPLFLFSGRHNVALNIDFECITEEDLLKAISQAYELHLRPLGYMFGGTTAYADISTLPGHYVLFWELVRAESNHIASDIDRTVMEKCCLTVEGCFDQMYRKSRHRGSIRALEIRVVKHGAFDALMDFFVSRGASPSHQAIRSEEALMVLEERVSGRFFNPETPSGPVYEYERK
ncbi:hypothetical protein ACQ4PT_066377 [Festuca glaucescens]